MIKNRVLRQLRRLFLAEIDIRSARQLCEQALGNFEQLMIGEISRAIEGGIIISYARPFGENKGVGRLPAKFSQFDTPHIERFHSRVLKARDLLIAHYNILEAGVLLSPQVPSTDSEKIMIEVQADGQTGWEIKAPTLDKAVLEELHRLCAFQEQRVGNEARKILTEVSSGAAYSPGCYTLGEDFP